MAESDEEFQPINSSMETILQQILAKITTLEEIQQMESENNKFFQLRVEEELGSLLAEAPNPRRSREINPRNSLMLPLVSNAEKKISMRVAVPPEQKIKSVTPSAYRRLHKTTMSWNTAHKDDRTLAEFCSQEVLKSLLDYEERYQTSISREYTPESIISASDEVITEMWVNSLRPKCDEDYITLMATSTHKGSKVKPLISTYSNFEVKDYDKALFPIFSEILKEFIELDFFCRKKPRKTEDEAKLPTYSLPKYELGKEKTPGVFRVLLSCFNPYGTALFSLLTEERMKKCTTLEQFTNLIREESSKICKLSEEIRRQDTQMKVPEKVEDQVTFIKSKIEEKSMQDKFKRGQIFTPSKQVPNVSFIQNSSKRTPGAKVGELMQVFEKHTPRYQVDNSESEEELTLQQEEEEFDQEILALQGQSSSKLPFTSSFPTKLPSTPAPTKVRGCYTMAMGNECPKGSQCNWSHDQKDLIAAIDEINQKSPYSPVNRAKLRIIEASLSSSSTQDSSPLPQYGAVSSDDH